MAIDAQPALSPHLVVDDANAAIDFYVKAFGAVEMGRVPRQDGKLIHGAVQIDGSLVMLADDFPEMSDGKSMTPKALGGTPVTIHLTVNDVDSRFRRAVDAGATVVMPLEEIDLVFECYTAGWRFLQPSTRIQMMRQCSTKFVF